MTKSEAHRLLDAARAGADVSTEAITAALRVTGDVTAHLADEDPPRQVRCPIGSWEHAA